MRPDEHLHRLASETKWCPKRGTCPLAFLCGAPLADGRALLPAIDEFDREDLVWTDLSTRPRVHVVRSGLLLSKVYTSDDQEFPYALFSEGFVSGLTELYTPFVASSFYYLQGIIPGQICRFDSDDVREIVDGLPASQSLALANITLMNSSTANYGQILTLAHGTARDKVASVLVRIVNQLSAHGEPPTDRPPPHPQRRGAHRAPRAGHGQPGAERARQGWCRGARLPAHPLPETLFSTYRHLLEGRLPHYDTARSASSLSFAQCVDRHN